MELDYKVTTIRSAAILTNSYVAADVLGGNQILYDDNQLVLLVDFTIGSLTSAQIKVEFSADNSTWFQETFSALSGTTDTLSLGEHSMAATGKYTIPVPIKYRYIRVSAKGTGTVTDSSLAIYAITGDA